MKILSNRHKKVVPTLFSTRQSKLDLFYILLKYIHNYDKDDDDDDDDKKNDDEDEEQKKAL